MSISLRASVILAAATIPWAAPLVAQETSFPATLDEAYTGSLSVDLFPVDGGSSIFRDWGSAEVIFSRLADGTVQFTTTGEIDEENGFEVSVILTEQADGIWRSLSPEGMVQLDPEGKLLSISLDGGFELIWTGQFDAQGGALTFRRFPTDAAPAEERDFTAIFSLDVERPRPVPQPEPEQKPQPGSEDEAASDGNGDCERIEWRLVNRWNPWGGGLSLEREPFCVN
ncbi:hypothetical protein [Pelagibacterium mangrovi]|uniref:hypothetical protein n=1 Tax=Pelagibacterium mangrovi TaxID=3119828 RepID=UPI002FC96D4E